MINGVKALGNVSECSRFVLSSWWQCGLCKFRIRGLPSGTVCVIGERETVLMWEFCCES